MGDMEASVPIQNKYPDAPDMPNIGQDHANSCSTRNEIPMMKRKYEEKIRSFLQGPSALNTI